jgi:alkanesulfonate monooxygenase SsuD/methylene tetrahydromethanopterin reductase-like flavin-dependent oxidoreductase (luciferase family)
VLSGGRAYFGIGAGWNERETRGLGIPFPATLEERVERFEETLRIARHMWSGNTAPFIGTYNRLEEPLNSPQPLSRPHPPIMVGMWAGAGQMLRLTAQYADAFNLQIGTPLSDFPEYIRERFNNHRAYLSEKLDKLRCCCNEEGRPFDELEATVLGTVRPGGGGMSAEWIAELCRELEELGFHHVIFSMPNVHEIEPLAIFGRDVIPQLASV